MSNGVGSLFLPDHLSAVSDRWHAFLRPVWLVTLALTLVLDIAGAVWVLRDSYVHDPSFARLGLNSGIENDGSVTIESTPNRDGRPVDIPPGSRIVAIDGRPVAQSTRVWDVAGLLERRDNQAVHVTIRLPGGTQVERNFIASEANRAEGGAPAIIPRDARISIRIAVSFGTCLALLFCAALLYRRRARDPVALLLSFSFLQFAGCIDPPLTMWIGIGLGDWFDAYSTLAWALLVIALATFPDGQFLPRSLRYLLVLVPLACIPLVLDETPTMVSLALGFIAPLGLIATHVAKYRRFEPGIERQQLKWAAFGFATGFVLLVLAFSVLQVMPESSTWRPLIGLIILILFEGGFLAMAIGLLVSLIRFRLWEADRVISKSAVSAAVTLCVGIPVDAKHGLGEERGGNSRSASRTPSSQRLSARCSRPGFSLRPRRLRNAGPIADSATIATRSPRSRLVSPPGEAPSGRMTLANGRSRTLLRRRTSVRARSCSIRRAGVR